MSKDFLNTKAIGIFDSGIGGLTVVKEIVKLLPNENLIYLGDTARVPYGNKSRNTVIKYALSNTTFLLSKGIKLLVVACNTASAYSLNTLQSDFEIPIIGVIDPGAKKAVETTKNGNVGVIGTPSTVRSEAYQKAINKIDQSIKVFSIPCPLFVPLAEEGWHDGDIALKITNKYLEPFKTINIDVLILGCTHYPLLTDIIQKVVGNKVRLVDSAEETAKEILEKINNFKITIDETDHVTREFYLTDNSESFVTVASRFLGQKIDKIQVTDIV